MTHVHRTDYQPHAIRRAKERHGLDLTVSDLNRIVGLIEQGKSVLQGYTADKKERHAVPWGGKILPVVYDRAFRHVVTFWPHFKMRKNRDKRSTFVRQLDDEDDDFNTRIGERALKRRSGG